VTLRFRDEVRTPKDVGLPEGSEAPGAGARAFRAALRELRKDSWTPDALRDEGQEQLRELVERKRKRGADVIEVEGAVEGEGAEAGQDEGGEEPPELFDVIRQRLRAPSRAPRRRAAAKRTG